MIGSDDTVVSAEDVSKLLLRGVFTHNTRRSAKMLVLDVHHTDIFRYIMWKLAEEHKARALIAAGYDADFNGEAYKTISGQNGNNSVMMSREFMNAVKNNEKFNTWWSRDVAKVTDAKGNIDFDKLKAEYKPSNTFDARTLFRKMAEASHGSADPGLQYGDTINGWNTLAEDGRIEGSNPCVTGDTLVYVQEEGSDKFELKKISEVKSKKIKVVAYDFEKQKLVVVRGKNLGKTRENAQLVKLKTSKGEVRLTSDHKIMTQRGWIMAKDLVKGDKVYKIRDDVLKKIIDDDK